MGISVADPARLPSMDPDTPDEKLKIKRPNTYKLTGQTWVKRYAKRPTIVVPVGGTQSGTIYWSPGQQPTGVTIPATTAELQSKCHYTDYGAIIPYVGEYWIYLDSATAQVVEEVDGSEAMLALMTLGLKTRLIGGASGSTADVRDADANADFAAAFFGMVMNSRLAGFGAADWERLRVNSGAAAAQDETRTHLQAVTLVRGIDSTAVAAARSLGVEARNYNSYNGMSAISGGGFLGVAAIPLLYNIAAADIVRSGGFLEQLNGIGFPGVLPAREVGYVGGLRDRRFNLSLPADADMVSNNAAYDATAPAVLVVNPATNEMIVRKIRIHVNEPVPIVIDEVMLRIVVDPDNRYSSGGVSFIPTGNFKSTNRGGSGTYTPTQAVYDDGATAIVATAADNDETEYGDYTFAAGRGFLELSFEDEIIIPPSGSLLLYLFGAGSSATMDLKLSELRIEVANVQ